MAVTDEIINATVTRQPLEKPPQIETMWSAVPRAVIHFIVDEDVLAAKAINDDEHLRISGALPAGFAYQFIQIACTLTQDVAKSWNNTPILRCVNWVPHGPGTLHFPVRFHDADEFADASAVSPIQVLQMLDPGPHVFGRQLIFNPGFTASFSFLAENETDPAGLAGTVSFLASFWEYDLTQATRFGINTPIPVQIR